MSSISMYYLVIFILAFSLHGSFSAGLGPLDAYRWKNRILIVSAETQDHPAFLQQQELLDEDGVEFSDRDLISFHLFKNKGFGPAGHPLESAQLIFLREQYDLDAHPFTILLIRKDGTVKRASNEPVDQESLYAQIDSMPMRKIEMQQRK